MKLKSIQEYVSPLETLFVFGTNKNAIKQVINFEEEEDFQTVDLKLTKLMIIDYYLSLRMF